MMGNCLKTSERQWGSAGSRGWAHFCADFWLCCVVWLVVVMPWWRLFDKLCVSVLWVLLDDFPPCRAMRRTDAGCRVQWERRLNFGSIACSAHHALCVYAVHEVAVTLGWWKTRDWNSRDQWRKNTAKRGTENEEPSVGGENEGTGKCRTSIRNIWCQEYCKL